MSIDAAPALQRARAQTATKCFLCTLRSAVTDRLGLLALRGRRWLLRRIQPWRQPGRGLWRRRRGGASLLGDPGLPDAQPPLLGARRHHRAPAPTVSTTSPQSVFKLVHIQPPTGQQPHELRGRPGRRALSSLASVPSCRFRRSRHACVKCGPNLSDDNRLLSVHRIARSS